MPWIIASMVALAFLFSYFGWKWERGVKRPECSSFPLVSVLIPSYRCPQLKESVESAKALDYPNKEIIVTGDAETPEIEGVKIIRNKKRIGKSMSLNQAVAIAKGEILFFLDSDTTVSPDALKKLVPWFSEGVAAVSPKFIAKNRKNLITKLISLEHQFVSSLFKIHMHFGSLISFRGCGIAIKKDIFQELGGWRNTLIEDTDFAATLLKKGYKILYEPEAVIRTGEPSSWAEFKKQRVRWGKGTGFSFLHHRKFYMKNPQFGLYVFPYLLLFLAIAGVFLYQTTIYMLPLASIYLIYTLSLKEFTGIFIIFIFPLAGNLFTSTTIASIGHFAIVTNSERRELKDLFLILPYVFVYFPFTIGCYFRGMLSAASASRKNKPELDFKDW